MVFELYIDCYSKINNENAVIRPTENRQKKKIIPCNKNHSFLTQKLVPEKYKK